MTERRAKYNANGLPTEHEEQKALFAWAAYNEGKWPELKRMFAIPNGGHRHVKVAMRMKEEGVKAGVPDIFLPAARCGWHGLFVELKVGRNKPTELQAEWLEDLTLEGYLAVTCWGFDEAAALIESYLEDNK